MADNIIIVKVRLSPEGNPELYETICGLPRGHRSERLKDLAFLGMTVMQKKLTVGGNSAEPDKKQEQNPRPKLNAMKKSLRIGG
ncbi:hypothetical protein GSUB_16960 (plasmid) [Geoalkalibacter subterraneus]|uniref:Uncharacterized protein n=1 Tax=Geoalkalibacter subterraneus TaxID=483547 RepID=A0A0B5FU41_9BACT|nr:hypothetical protein GSUB_16960 [Geoalkalibacter subterraneus]